MNSKLNRERKPIDLTTKYTHRRLASGGAMALALSLLLGGCATEAEFLAENKPAAVNTALSRGRFELNCSQASAEVLSQKVTYINGLGVGRAGGGGYEWTEYTIGVRGCDKQAVYMIACRDQDNCNAFAQTSRLLSDIPQ